MAVYKRGYEGYEGPLSPAWSRFLIVARHGYARIFDSRFLVTFFGACFLPPLVGAVLIYLPHNLGAIKLLELKPNASLAAINRLLLNLMIWQGTLAWVMTGFIGPGLVSPDLRNGALPLYLCRPVSRAEYVLGKIAALILPLSAITWAPLLALFLLESGLEGGAWIWTNAWLAAAIFFGSWIWILTLCLLSLATSACVKWKVLAGALLFGIFFVVAGFGAAINHALHTKAGHLINLGYVVATVWTSLFRVRSNSDISAAAAWTVLLATCAICLVLLARKVRACEVVRS